MLICIDSGVIGTKKHLLCGLGTDREWFWSSSVPHDAWVFGSYAVDKSLDAVLDFFSLEHPVIGSQPHIRSFKLLLGYEKYQIPWHQVLPEHEFQETIKRLITILEKALKTFLDMDYGETFMKSRGLLLGLSRASVDGPRLSAYIQNEKNPTIRSTLKSFQPNGDKRAPRVEYCQTGTVTGRLTISSGPQILTLPKKYRNIITSRYPGGYIAQVDFTSLEPRIARLTSGYSAENDVYLQLSRELFESSLQREEVKIAVLCALYGVSKQRLASMLGKEFQADVIIREIKSFFGIPKLVKDLKTQMIVNNRIMNHFGRVVESAKMDDNILINHYIQSTAVDAAILGFHKLVQALNGLAADPLFIIHDALVLDISPKAMHDVKDILQNGLVVPTMGMFPVELSIIREPSE